MPTYEMPVLLRQMAKPAVRENLRKVADAIFSNGGFIRKIDNLGDRPLPLKIFYQGETHRTASHFIFYFDVPAKAVSLVTDECTRNYNIIKSAVFKHEQPKPVECTLEEELLPPPYRKEVKEMLEIEKMKEKKKVKYDFNCGLDYYPFQR